MDRKNLDVLIVDDQPGVRYLLDVIITEEGHMVRMARNGLEAVESVKSARPDLVIMDVRMPQMCGIEALGKIKIISPETEVVLMTAYVSDETVQMALKKGALCCFTKPFDVDGIKAFIADFSWRTCVFHDKLPAVVG
ncbi:MAG: histidine kinase [Peptococcaceae bacterium BRH_c4a]|nr:MAG: histidine kinase [Peptococcaceae bacterium BRH_c4a]